MSEFSPLSLLQFNYAYGVPSLQGWLKEQPDYFCVDELLGFELSGVGEHLYLQIEKQGLNTADVATQLAAVFAVRPLDVGYAGMKDKHAVTRQWFSLYLPKKPQLELESIRLDMAQIKGVKLIAAQRHHQKLRRGQHQGNRFNITLTQLSGNLDLLSERMTAIASKGVPNYFGPQRFGINGNNLLGVQGWFVDKRPPRRQLRGIYLSTARSFLFNRLLSARVAENSWARVEEGDLPCPLAGANTEAPTGPLWGRGRIKTSAHIAELENELAREYAQWCHGLEHSGLQQERRPLCLFLRNFQWFWENQKLQLSFELPVGCYATSVIREICIYEDRSRWQAQTENVGEG